MNESLERLQVDYVDVVQLHNGPTVQRPVLEEDRYNVLGIEDYYAPNGAIEGLKRVRRQGKTHFLGFIVRGNDRGPVRSLSTRAYFT